MSRPGNCLQGVREPRVPVRDRIEIQRDSWVIFLKNLRWEECITWVFKILNQPILRLGGRLGMVISCQWIRDEAVSPVLQFGAQRCEKFRILEQVHFQWCMNSSQAILTR